MMVREITLSLGRTINVGNFESLRVDVSFSARLDQGEDVDKAYDELREEVREKLKDCILVNDER